jgi:hypothetical protein
MEDLNPGWRTSSHSGNGGECVEVGCAVGGMIMIRDTKNPGGTVCRYNPVAWRGFVARVRSGALGSGEPGSVSRGSLSEGRGPVRRSWH